MARAMAAATCTAFGAVLEASGERAGRPVLYERISHLAAWCEQLTRSPVAAGWDEASLDMLAAGVDENGGKLPSKGWMALRRLGWTRPAGTEAAPGDGLPEGVYVSDRVRRAAREYAARTLRLALHRRAIVTAVLDSWPADPSRRSAAKWAALRAALPPGVSTAEIRNRTRQVGAFAAEQGRLPSGLCESKGPPEIAPLVLPAAMDGQQVTLDRLDATTARLRVKLPLCPAPGSGREWAWHVLDIRLPAPVGPDAVLHTPALRLTRSGRIAVDLPHSLPAPARKATGHTVAVGLDWGVNTLLTGMMGRLTGKGERARVVTDGRPLIFDATAISATLHRLRGHREQLAAKRDHYRQRADHLGSPHLVWSRLLDGAAVLDLEHARVSERIRRLRDHAAARRGVSRGLLAQAHTATDRTTGVRSIRATVEATVALVRRPKKITRRLRRTRQREMTPPRPRGPTITPGRGHPTPSRPQPGVRRWARHTTPAPAPSGAMAEATQTSRRMPAARTAPAATPTGVAQRPAGHDTQTPAATRPVPGHGPTTPAHPGVHPPDGPGRRSRGTCRRRTRAAERTGFHHLHATQVHPLPPRSGPPDGTRRRPRRARKA
ncbi:hypothetical protein [Streptomyces sp. SD15]